MGGILTDYFTHTNIADLFSLCTDIEGKSKLCSLLEGLPMMMKEHSGWEKN